MPSPYFRTHPRRKAAQARMFREPKNWPFCTIWKNSTTAGNERRTETTTSEVATPQTVPTQRSNVQRNMDLLQAELIRLRSMVRTLPIDEQMEEIARYYDVGRM